MLRIPLLAVAAAATASTSFGQVDAYFGVSTNFGTLLDFDTPLVPLGPIAGNSATFTGNNIDNVTVLGTWTSAGDVLNAASNTNGNALVVNQGALEVGADQSPLDGPDAGSGIEFELAGLVDEFGLNFADQINFTYDIEVFDGATSVGTGSFTFGGGFPRPGVFWRSTAMFDRVVLTFPLATPGVGFDEFGQGSGPPPPPLPDECVETIFDGGNGGNAGGAIYFDLTAGASTSITGLLTHYSAAVGSPVGIEVYTASGSHVGNEGDPTAWTLAAMDDGSGLSAGPGVPSAITFASAWSVPSGTIGVALVAVGSAHSYTNGNGMNQSFTSGDGNLSLSLGTATNVPFTLPAFDPRVWNGRLCASGPVSLGSNYCMANPNSTGSIGSMSATGSASAASNDLTLMATGLPNNQFGIFVTSTTQGFVPGAGGTSNGNLCVGGSIGRFSEPNQILNTGGSGEMSLVVDTTQVPQGSAFVSIMPGETWNFQGWHRDPVGVGSNFTDGLEIMFN